MYNEYCMNDKLSFIRAPRFWIMLAGALSVYLQTKGFIGEAEMMLIATVSAGFVAVKTLDRYSDKRIEAANIESDTIYFDRVK